MTKNQYENNIRNVVRKIGELEQISKTPDISGNSDNGIFIDNISQQGLLKEIIMAENLGHYVNRNKKQFDAFSVIDHNLNMPDLEIGEYSNIVDNSLRTININNIDYSVKQYEYLTSLCETSSNKTKKYKNHINNRYLSEGSFQYHDLKINSIDSRINQYNSTYFGVFDKSYPINLISVYEFSQGSMKDLVIKKIAKLFTSKHPKAKSNFVYKADQLQSRNPTDYQTVITYIKESLTGSTNNLVISTGNNNILDENVHISIKLSDVM